MKQKDHILTREGRDWCPWCGVEIKKQVPKAASCNECRRYEHFSRKNKEFTNV